MGIFENFIEGIWRWRPSSPGGSPWAFLLCLVIVSSALGVWPKSAGAIDVEWTHWRPFVPEKMDYSFELGSMWEREPLYWMSAHVGKHIGLCMFSESESCQQYADVILGVGGRQGQTDGMLLGGLRWQFVSYPKIVSPSVSLFAGLARLNDTQRESREAFTYGMGLGWTFPVHDRADLRLEVRGGGGDKLWAQALFGIHLSLDKWVDYFAERIKGTIKTSGEVMGTVIVTPIKKAADVTRETMGNTKDQTKDSVPEKEAGKENFTTESDLPATSTEGPNE